MPRSNPVQDRRITAHVLDAREDSFGFFLQTIGQRLDVPGASERVGHVGEPRSPRDHLLRAQGDLGGFLTGQSQHLVQGVGVQRSWSRRWTAAIASTAVRTTLLSGCAAVSETPAVWV